MRASSTGDGLGNPLPWDGITSVQKKKDIRHVDGEARGDSGYNLDDRLKRLARLLAQEAAREFVEEQANDREERE